MICRMTNDDLDFVADIESRVFSEPWSRSGFKDVLDREDVIFLVARVDDEVAGYIGAYVSLDEAEITNVCVDYGFRGRHIGNELVTSLICEAEQMNVSRIVLEVRVSNESAISLYEKNGFVKLGVRKNFYRAPIEDAYIMERIKC